MEPPSTSDGVRPVDDEVDDEVDLVFSLASICDLSSDSASTSGSALGVARFCLDRGTPWLRFFINREFVVGFDLGSTQMFQFGPVQSLCIFQRPDKSKESTEGFKILFNTEEESRAFHLRFKLWKDEFVSQGTSKSKFDEKIEASSANLYFQYYGQLIHQQNMLQDYVRTGTYYAAVMENHTDFSGQVVVDVGAGSGILSLFAAQAGARHVYAVEASEMAEHARKLIAGNPALSERITVIKGKIEEVELPEKADILISEPMGTLLVNERMLESYVIARERFLVPGGKMFPSVGRIHVAPFSDDYLYLEIATKSVFWQQRSYYGVDLTPLHGAAFQGYFSQPVVDAFDPMLLVAPPLSHIIDFTEIKEEDLYEIDIPLEFTATDGTKVHGIACWFDVLFDGSAVPRWLTTAPEAPTTHWFQLRCVLSQPFFVMPGQEITGRLHMIAHSAQSYTIHLTLSAKMWGPGAEQGGILQTSSGKFELKDPYYRFYYHQAYHAFEDQQQPPQDFSVQPQDVEETDLLEPTQNSGVDIGVLLEPMQNSDVDIGVQPQDVEETNGAQPLDVEETDLLEPTQNSGVDIGVQPQDVEETDLLEPTQNSGVDIGVRPQDVEEIDLLDPTQNSGVDFSAQPQDVEETDLLEPTQNSGVDFSVQPQDVEETDLLEPAQNSGVDSVN